MALQINYTSPQGVVAPTAYARIQSFSGNKTGVNVQVAFYLDALAAKGLPAVAAVPAVPPAAGQTAGSPAVAAVAAVPPKTALGTKQYFLTIADGATMAQLYTALAARPEFAGAVSV